MPQENVELVRRLYAGWANGDFAVELESFDPAVELVIDYGPDQLRARGFEEVSRLWQDQLSLWDSLSTGAPEEVIAHDDHVVVTHSLRGRSKRGLSLESQNAGAAITFRDRRIVRIVATDDITKALEAVGLRHGDDAAGYEAGR